MSNVVGVLNGKTVTELTGDDLRACTQNDLVVIALALIGVLHMKECDLARERVARYSAEYNYAGTKLAQAQEQVKRADEINRGVRGNH